MENKFKVKINMPNKIILYCAAIEMFNLDEEYYLKEGMLLKDVYKGLKETLKEQAISYKETKNKVEIVTIALKVNKDLIKKTYNISFKIKEIKNEETQKSKYH